VVEKEKWPGDIGVSENNSAENSPAGGNHFWLTFHDSCIKTTDLHNGIRRALLFFKPKLTAHRRTCDPFQTASALVNSKTREIRPIPEQNVLHLQFSIFC